jgi:anti-sigma factor RsiW
MRCSSCEPLLDRYVEGTLSPREMLAIRVHLETCASCSTLLTELRVVDALLATTQPIDLAPNFTFAVMAEARGVEMVRPRRYSVRVMLALYLAVAWLVATLSYVAVGGHGPYVDAVRGLGTSLAAQAGALIQIITRSFGTAEPLVLGGVVTVLFLDALLIVALLFFYRSARARGRSEAS